MKQASAKAQLMMPFVMGMNAHAFTAGAKARLISSRSAPVRAPQHPQNRRALGTPLNSCPDTSLPSITPPMFCSAMDHPATPKSGIAGAPAMAASQRHGAPENCLLRVQRLFLTITAAEQIPRAKAALGMIILGVICRRFHSRGRLCHTSIPTQPTSR
jgi:hypothetical protein